MIEHSYCFLCSRIFFLPYIIYKVFLHEPQAENFVFALLNFPLITCPKIGCAFSKTQTEACKIGTVCLIFVFFGVFNMGCLEEKIPKLCGKV